MALWSQQDRVGDAWPFRVWANRFTNRAGWGKAALLQEDPLGDVNRNVALAANENGDAVAVWVLASEDKPTRVQARRYSASSGWDAVETISETDERSVSAPDVALDGTGNAVVVWSVASPRGSQVWASLRPTGTEWQKPSLLHRPGEAYCLNPHVALNAAGNGFAIWEQAALPSTVLATRECLQGAGWREAEIVHRTGWAEGAGYNRIVLGRGGEALALWLQQPARPRVLPAKPAHSTLYAKWYDPGEGWGKAQALLQTADEDAVDPECAIGAHQTAAVIWSEQTSGKRTPLGVCVRSYTAAAAWQQKARLEHAYTTDPHIAINDRGQGIAVWTCMKGDRTAVRRGEIWASRLKQFEVRVAEESGRVSPCPGKVCLR